MNRMEYYINVLHFVIYKGDYKAHKLFERINPLMLIHKLPFQKRKYEKERIDIYKELDEAFKDPVAGISSMRAGGITGLLFMIIGGSLFIITDKKLDDRLDDLLMFVFMLPFGLVFYYNVLCRDKYLKYFESFEKKPADKKRLWAWMSFAVIVGIFSLLALSFLS